MAGDGNSAPAAGLTLTTVLKNTRRVSGPKGYMVDFFSTGNDVAKRMGPTQKRSRQRLAFVRHAHRGAWWIGEMTLDAYRGREPFYFDALTQIAVPRWAPGRVALLGDACGCLTLLAGQGAHIAMAGTCMLAQDLQRYKKTAPRPSPPTRPR